MVGRICPPGGDRVKVSQNLGATSVAPVALVDTSLNCILSQIFLLIFLCCFCSGECWKPTYVILSTSSLLYNVVGRYISTMSRVAGARLAKLVTTPQRRVSILSSK